MLKSSSDVVCFGEMLIDFVPDVVGVSLAESAGFVKAPGGAPANIACAFTKLGGSSAFIGKFGDDEFGHMLVDVLMKNEVNTKGLLLVTDGEKGCRYFTKNFKGSVEGYSVKTADTTGAGDAFIGSVLHSASRDSSVLENEIKLKNALQVANACGAICTTAKGVIPALPDHAAAHNLMHLG
ncbi:hypothetical protein MKX03_017427 [Papaver bracteatum]|nr:hypothetical protein MKX03_017427 [Papaver bracteatum]